MGRQTIREQIDGAPYSNSWANRLKKVFLDSLVPRNADGIPEAESGDLGAALYRWDNFYANRLAFGEGKNFHYLKRPPLAASRTITLPPTFAEPMQGIFLNGSAMSTALFDTADFADGAATPRTKERHYQKKENTPIIIDLATSGEQTGADSFLTLESSGNPIVFFMYPYFNAAVEAALGSQSQNVWSRITYAQAVLASTVGATLKLRRGLTSSDTLVGRSVLRSYSSTSGSLTGRFKLPFNQVFYDLSPPVGSVTYRLFGERNAAGTGTIVMNNISLFAMELG